MIDGIYRYKIQYLTSLSPDGIKFWLGFAKGHADRAGTAFKRATKCLRENENCKGWVMVTDNKTGRHYFLTERDPLL